MGWVVICACLGMVGEEVSFVGCNLWLCACGRRCRCTSGVCKARSCRQIKTHRGLDACKDLSNDSNAHRLVWGPYEWLRGILRHTWLDHCLCKFLLNPRSAEVDTPSNRTTRVSNVRIEWLIGASSCLSGVIGSRRSSDF